MAVFNPSDYDSAHEALTAELSGKANWSDRKDTATGQAFIHVFAYAVQQLANSLNKTVDNFYPTNSVSKKGTFNFARFVGYRPTRVTQAVGKMKIILDSVQTTPTYVPFNYAAVTAEAIPVAVLSDVFIPAGASELEVDIWQGQYVEQSQFSNGELRQRYFVVSDKISDSYFKVYVDNVEWEEVDTFNFSSADSTHYTVKATDTGVLVQFGDNLHGQAPINNAEIKFVYLSTEGEEGNIFTTGLEILTPSVTIFNGLNQEVGHTIEVTEAITGGAAAETFETVRASIGRFISTSNGVISRANFIDFLKLYSYIIDAEVYPAFDTVGMDIVTMNLTNIVPVPVGGGSLNQSTKDQITEDLETLKPIENRIAFLTPEYINVIFDVVAIAESNQNLASVQNLIENKIADDMDFENRVEGGLTIFGGLEHSVYVTGIQGLDGVKSLVLNLLIRGGEFTTSLGVYSYAFSLDLTEVKPGTVTVKYADDGTVLATDDESGSFTGTFIDGGGTNTIDYVGGSGNIEFLPTIDDDGREIVFEYQQITDDDDDNVVSTAKTQVFQLYESRVLVE